MMEKAMPVQRIISKAFGGKGRSNGQSLTKDFNHGEIATQLLFVSKLSYRSC